MNVNDGVVEQVYIRRDSKSSLLLCLNSLLSFGIINKFNCLLIFIILGECKHKYICLFKHNLIKLQLPLLTKAFVRKKY